MDIRRFDTPEAVSLAVAARVAEALAARARLVLGLAAGRTPIGAYAELRRLHRAGVVSFARAVTFNLDEFAGIPPSHPGSFRTFMEGHLFSGIDLPLPRIHFLDGGARDLDAECQSYEGAIASAGGLDLQLLGIGSNGHIGFNEPGEALVARTHRVQLAESTRRDNAPLFGGDASRVPHEALSMGMGTILSAARIVLIATGARKARCVERMVTGPVSTRLPASFLQLHGRAELFVDAAAASRL